MVKFKKNLFVILVLFISLLCTSEPSFSYTVLANKPVNFYGDWEGLKSGFINECDAKVRAYAQTITTDIGYMSKTCTMQIVQSVTSDGARVYGPYNAPYYDWLYDQKKTSVTVTKYYHDDTYQSSHSGDFYYQVYQTFNGSNGYVVSYPFVNWVGDLGSQYIYDSTAGTGYFNGTVATVYMGMAFDSSLGYYAVETAYCGNFSFDSNYYSGSWCTHYIDNCGGTKDKCGVSTCNPETAICAGNELTANDYCGYFGHAQCSIDCVADPSNPSCAPGGSQFCIDNPTDNSCTGNPGIDCVANPDDPACSVGGNQYCFDNPTAPACNFNSEQIVQSVERLKTSTDNVKTSTDSVKSSVDNVKSSVDSVKSSVDAITDTTGLGSAGIAQGYTGGTAGATFPNVLQTHWATWEASLSQISSVGDGFNISLIGGWEPYCFQTSQMSEQACFNFGDYETIWNLFGAVVIFGACILSWFIVYGKG